MAPIITKAIPSDGPRLTKVTATVEQNSRVISNLTRLWGPSLSAIKPLQTITSTPKKQATEVTAPANPELASRESSKYETIHEYSGCEPAISKNDAIPNQ